MRQRANVDDNSYHLAQLAGVANEKNFESIWDMSAPIQEDVDWLRLQEQNRDTDKDDCELHMSVKWSRRWSLKVAFQLNEEACKDKKQERVHYNDRNLRTNLHFYYYY